MLYKEQLVYDDPIDILQSRDKLGFTHILVNGEDFVEMDKLKTKINLHEKLMLYRMGGNDEWIMAMGKVTTNPEYAIILCKQRDMEYT